MYISEVTYKSEPIKICKVQKSRGKMKLKESLVLIIKPLSVQVPIPNQLKYKAAKMWLLQEKLFPPSLNDAPTHL